MSDPIDALVAAAYDMVARDMILNQGHGLDPSPELESLVDALAAVDAAAEVHKADSFVIEEAMRCYILESWEETPSLRNACHKLLALRSAAGGGESIK